MAANASEAWNDEDAVHIAQAVYDAPSGAILVVDCEIPVSILEQAMQATGRCGIKIILDPTSDLTQSRRTIDILFAPGKMLFDLARLHPAFLSVLAHCVYCASPQG